MDKQAVTIKISFGLLALAAGHALLIAALGVGTDAAKSQVSETAFVLPDYEPPRPNFAEPSLSAPTAIPNRPGLEEIKKQSGNCIPCRQPVYVQPVYRQPVYVQPQPQPVFVTPPATPKTLPAPRAVTPTKPTAPRHQIALFVDTSPAGQTLLSWFNNDPQLSALKAKVDFQVYTPSNALYQSRFASIVPPSQFPAVLFLRPDGGHIHATGGNMLPRSAAELHSDLQSSFQLAQSVEQAPVPVEAGAMRERGYNWDNAMQEQSITTENPESCRPGQPCYPDNGGGLLPIFDRQPDQDKSVMAWFSATEIVICVLSGLAVLLVVVIVLKRM